ncbi:hypothetical protein [Azospirillum doebereinerae]|uniref:Uncharacterized protein n=1 Tax=Azospirillum doebereinerae TaxID=92933 RepID=A0A433J791_9PROT|nr:hypothetical protein [Azospirillum doebereinerae]RUQ69271.1 hypothetical protein EJ913_15985 [Azospirillum doebereinerae]
MKTARATTTAALSIAALLALAPMAAKAQGAGPGTAADPAGNCSPTVSAALGTWDSGMAAAAWLGDRAVAVAREKGREYLLPLLGIDPKTPPSQSDAEAGRTTDDVAREVEASRDDPKRRAALCAAITSAANEARSTAGAGWDALKRAVEGLRPTAPATPNPPATTTPEPGGLIKT